MQFSSLVIKLNVNVYWFIGGSVCSNPGCYSGIGPVMRFKRDFREQGFVISHKHILLRIKGGRPTTLNKWKNAPFKIEEEIVG